MNTSRRTFLNSLTAVSAAACTQRVVLSADPLGVDRTPAPISGADPLAHKKYPSFFM